MERALSDVQFELQFYYKALEASLDCPYSFRAHNARIELFHAIRAMSKWAGGRLDQIGGGYD